MGWNGFFNLCKTYPSEKSPKCGLEIYYSFAKVSNFFHSYGHKLLHRRYLFINGLPFHTSYFCHIEFHAGKTNVEVTHDQNINIIPNSHKRVIVS